MKKSKEKMGNLPNLKRCLALSLWTMAPFGSSSSAVASQSQGGEAEEGMVREDGDDPQQASHGDILEHFVRGDEEIKNLGKRAFHYIRSRGRANSEEEARGVQGVLKERGMQAFLEGTLDEESDRKRLRNIGSNMISYFRRVGDDKSALTAEKILRAIENGEELEDSESEVVELADPERGVRDGFVGSEELVSREQLKNSEEFESGGEEGLDKSTNDKYSSGASNGHR